MASLLEQINAAQYASRPSGVRYLPPVRVNRAAPRRAPIRRGRDEMDRDRPVRPDVFGDPDFDGPAEAEDPGLKGAAIHGLGWVIGNPVSKALLKPLESLSYPLAGVVGGVRQAFDTELMDQINRGVAASTGLEYSSLRNPDYEPGWQWSELWEDIKDHEGGGTSVVEPVFGPEGSGDPWGINYRRGLGFALDVGADPFSYVSTGTKAGAGLENRFNYVNKLLDAEQVASAESRAATEAAEFAAEHALLGGTGADAAVATNRAAAEAAQSRLDDLTRISGEDATNQILRRGVNVASPEQLEAMGVQQHALRFGGVAIPGRASEAASRAMSRFLAPGKELWSQTAGKAARKIVTPRGVLKQTLGPATERLVTGTGPVPREIALRAHSVNQAMRLAKGDFRAPANQFLHQFIDSIKGLSKEERAGLARQAEEQGVENAVTGLAPQMIQIMKSMGLDAPELQPWMLPNGEMSRYVMPHVMSRSAFRFFNRLRKGQNPMVDFIRRDLGIHDKDLLEEGGFLQRRLFRPNADGSPQTFKIGKDEIEITTGSVAELEEKLGGLLRQHGFEGKLYETDPAEAWRRYIISTEKDVARRVGEREGLKYGLPGWRAKPTQPLAWDPFGRDIQMQPAVGETEPRYIRGEAPRQGRPVADEVWEIVEDKEASKARDEIITKGGAKNVHQQVLGEYREAAPAVRENLAQQIENTRQYTEDAFNRAREQSARKLTKAEAVVTKTRERVDHLEQQYLELMQEASANNMLISQRLRAIHGIRSQTPKDIKAAVRARLAEISAELAHERGRLESLQGGLKNALAADEQAQIDAGLERIIGLNDAVDDAKRHLESTRNRAKKALADRIKRETRGQEHLVTPGEARQAEEVLAAGRNSEAAQRADELLARRDGMVAREAEHRNRALELKSRANRIDEQLGRGPAGSAPRTEGRQARMEGNQAELAKESKRLHREAANEMNRADNLKTELKVVEQRIKNDEWIKAQRTVNTFETQKEMLENYTNNRDIDMRAAQARYNAALRDMAENEAEAGEAAAADIAAMEAELTPAGPEPVPSDVHSRQPLKRLRDILGPDTEVHFRTIPPEESISPVVDPIRGWAGPWVGDVHTMRVSTPDNAYAAELTWNATTGEVATTRTADEFRRQGVGTELFDYATQYARDHGLHPPRHSPLQTPAGQKWAPAADAIIAARTTPIPTEGMGTPEARQARAVLDSDEAAEFLTDARIRDSIKRELAEPQGRLPDAPAEWVEVGRKPAAKPTRAQRAWSVRDGKRRRLLAEMERIRDEAHLSSPPTEESYRIRGPKGRKRRVKGNEPWWSEEFPTRPDLASSKRSRSARLARLRAQLDETEAWLAKNPQPPRTMPSPRALRLRTKINGKLVRLERETSVGALGGARWKIVLPDGNEQTFHGTMAEALRDAERVGREATQVVDEAAQVAEATQRVRLSRVEERLAQMDPEMIERVTRADRTLRGIAADTGKLEAVSPPPPTREDLVRRRFEPNIAESEQRLRQMGGRGTPQELEEVAAGVQGPANQRIAGLQGEIESLEFQNQRLGEMMEDIYQTKLPDPVKDWRGALDNAEQARAAHEQIKQYIEQYAVRQRALDIVERNRRAGAPTAADLKRVAQREMRPEDAQGLMDAVNDIEKFMQGADQILPVNVRRRIEAALMSYEQALATLTKTNDLPASALEKMTKQAHDGTLPKVLKAQLRETWNEVGDGSIIIDKEIQRMIFGIDEVLDSSMFGRLWTTWTNFFKTYATLTPGFHVRNALSAIFMNATEGVSPLEQIAAIRLWRRYRASENPIEFLAGLPAHERDAFRATFASGAGGQFLEGGVGEARAGAGRAVERAFSNPATRASKLLGEWVEGPQRLALGLHTTKAGGDAAAALALISRIHFDYSQVSKFDERMKRIIPFWTFMSRNMPLQFTQMWMKPKSYLHFQSFMRNAQLGNEDQPIIPDYITSAGGTYIGAKTPEWASKIPVIGPPAGMPIVLQPDLPHTRYADDLQRVQNALSGGGVGQMATNLNPMMTVPAEFTSRTDFFTGQTFDPEDSVQVGGLAMPYVLALSLVGQAKRGPDGNWYVDAAALNAARGLDPNLDRMMRLAPQAGGLESTDKTGASTTARQAESWARWLGLPVRTISEQQQRSALRKQKYDELSRRRELVNMGG